MRALRRLATVLGLGLIVGLAGPGDADAQRRTDDRPGDFDFYVLSLSWSPTYCEAFAERSPDQCGRGRSYAFVVHGLWPQYNRGYPDFCATDRREDLDRQTIDSMLDIMPARALVRHQWTKHGTCSGLAPADYFALTRKAYSERIKVPARFQGLTEHLRIGTEEVEQAFLEANPGLPKDGIAVTCSGNRLREVRICLTKDLDGFRSCHEVDRAQCRRDSVVLPPSRGR